MVDKLPYNSRRTSVDKKNSTLLYFVVVVVKNGFITNNCSGNYHSSYFSIWLKKIATICSIYAIYPKI